MFIHEPVELKYGELVCETLPTGRTYLTPEGKKYPSITTVLGSEGGQWIHEWRARVGAEEANRVGRVAAARGTSVHSLADKYLNNEVIDTKKLMPNALASFNGLKPVFSRIGKIFLQERAVYSDYLRIAGRLDLVAEFDGRISIVDFKTSNRVKKREDITSYFMQEAGYAIMFEERTGIPISQLVTIMTVDYHGPIVFIEKRDVWAPELIRIRDNYEEKKRFGKL
jgi:genome maintenance exonuclease 1